TSSTATSSSTLAPACCWSPTWTGGRTRWCGRPGSGWSTTRWGTTCGRTPPRAGARSWRARSPGCCARAGEARADGDGSAARRPATMGPMSAPLPDPDLVARLVADLRTTDYGVTAVEELIGPMAAAALHREESVPALRALARSAQP